MGNKGIYSVGKKFSKALYLFAKHNILWVSRERRMKPYVYGIFFFKILKEEN